MKINEVLNEGSQSVPEDLLTVGHRVKWAVQRGSDTMFGSIVKIENGILICSDDKFGTADLFRIRSSQVLEIIVPVEGSNMMQTVWKV